MGNQLGELPPDSNSKKDTVVVKPTRSLTVSLIESFILVGALLTGAILYLSYTIFSSLHNNYPTEIQASHIILTNPETSHELLLTPDGLSVKNKVDASLEPMAGIGLDTTKGAVIGVWGKGNRQNLDLSLTDLDDAHLIYIDKNGVSHDLLDLLKNKKPVGSVGAVGDKDNLQVEEKIEEKQEASP